jgi:hypothetical protein
VNPYDVSLRARSSRVNHQHVAGVEQAARLRPVGFGSARHFAQLFLGAGGTKLAPCAASLLPTGRYPRTLADHGPFCTGLRDKVDQS